MARARMVLVAAAVVALCARSTAGHPCTVGATTCTCVDQDGGEWDLSSLMGTFEVPTSTAWQYQVNLCGDVVPPMCAVDTGEAQVYRQNPANLICQTLSQPFDGPFDPTHPTTVEALEDGEGLAYSMAAAGTAGFQYTIRIEMTCDVEAGPGTMELVAESPTNEPVFSWGTDALCVCPPDCPPDPPPPSPGPDPEPEVEPESEGTVPIAIIVGGTVAGLALLGASFAVGKFSSFRPAEMIRKREGGGKTATKKKSQKRERPSKSEYTKVAEVQPIDRDHPEAPPGASFEEQLVYNAWRESQAASALTDNSSGSGLRIMADGTLALPAVNSAQQLLGAQTSLAAPDWVRGDREWKQLKAKKPLPTKLTELGATFAYKYKDVGELPPDPFLPAARPADKLTRALDKHIDRMNSRLA